MWKDYKWWQKAIFTTIFLVCMIGFFDAINKDKSFEAAAWIQAFGTVAAVLVAIWVMYRQQENQRQQELMRKEKDIENFLSGVRDEISLFRFGLRNGIGFSLEQVGENGALHAMAIMAEKPFNFYYSMQHIMGEMKDISLRQKIMAGYMLVESMIQLFLSHNELLEEFHQQVWLVALKNDVLEDKIHDRLKERIKKNTEILKRYYTNMNKSLDALLSDLPQDMPVENVFRKTPFSI